MSVKTLRNQFITALEARGETQHKCLTGYIVYTRKEGGYYFLGKSGALRFGPTRTASIPCSPEWKRRLLNGTLPQ